MSTKPWVCVLTGRFIVRLCAMGVVHGAKSVGWANQGGGVGVDAMDDHVWAMISGASTWSIK